jgi:hypothetical protein
VTTDLDTLLTALYVFVSDRVVQRRRIGRPLLLDDGELLCLAIAQVLLGFAGERHWTRYARKHLRHLFPYVLEQSGYNKRLRSAGPLISAMIRELALVTPTGVEGLRLIDSTPVPCGMSLGHRGAPGVGQEFQDRADGQSFLAPVPEPAIAVDGVLGAPAHPAAGDVPGLLQVGNDRLGGAFGQPCVFGQVPDTGRGVLSDGDQDVPVTSQEGPRAGRAGCVHTPHSNHRPGIPEEDLAITLTVHR